MKMKTDNIIVLIYQMGKVGSQTVYNSLLKVPQLRRRVHHVHQLSPAGLRKRVAIFGNDGTDRTLDDYTNLKSRIDAEYYTTTWKVITMVRDTIATHISSMFENMQLIPTFGSHLQKGEHRDAAKVLLGNLWPNRYFYDWFENELRCVFGVNIYDYPFDRSKGYDIIHKNNIDVLMLRLESLNDTFQNAMRDFLMLDNIPMIVSNETGKKEDGKAYEEVLGHIRLPLERCIRFYETGYVRHFYSDNEINKFMERWCNK